MSKLLVTVNGQMFEIDVVLTQECARSCTAVINGQTISFTIPPAGQSGAQLEWVIINERPYELTVDENLHWVRAYSGLHDVEIQDREARVTRPRSGDGRVKAPIPGLVTRILVAAGEEVKADQPLIVLEAMKMENEIRAPFDGVVTSITVAPGDSVVRDAILARIS